MFFKNESFNYVRNGKEFYDAINYILKNRFYQFNQASPSSTYPETSTKNFEAMNRLLLNKKDVLISIYDQIQIASDLERGLHGESGSQNTGDNDDIYDKMATFEQQFISYLDMLDSNGDENKGTSKHLQERLFLRNLIFFVGIFWELSTDMVDCAQTTDKSELIELSHDISKYYNLGLIDVCCVNDNVQTLYHIATACDNGAVFDILLQCDNDCQKFKDIFYKVKSLVINQ